MLKSPIKDGISWLYAVLMNQLQESTIHLAWVQTFSYTTNLLMFVDNFMFIPKGIVYIF